MNLTQKSFNQESFMFNYQQAQETFKMRLTIATSILWEASKKN